MVSDDGFSMDLLAEFDHPLMTNVLPVKSSMSKRKGIKCFPMTGLARTCRQRFGRPLMTDALVAKSSILRRRVAISLPGLLSNGGSSTEQAAKVWPFSHGKRGLPVRISIYEKKGTIIIARQQQEHDSFGRDPVNLPA
jgi:hypothetical protein